MSIPEAAVREYPSVLAVSHGYGLDATNYAATPGGYLLDTATGKYWLKPFAGSDKELSFVVAASEHLIKRGFPFVTRCLRLSDGSPGIRFRRVLFYMVQAAPGPAAKLESVEDLKAAGARLGWLHLAARAFTPPPGLDDIRVEWGSCERVFKERLLDLYDFQETCADRPRRTRFDSLYLERFNDFVDAAREAVDIVADLPLARMIAAARAERQLCHGDFVPSALAIDGQGEYVVTDLEMVRYDLRAADIAELIGATHEYDASRAGAVIEGYHAAFPLAQEDVRLIEAYLRFPRDYWRAANAYYREGINARARLNETVVNHDLGRRFLDSFRRIVEGFRSSDIFMESTAEPEQSDAPDVFYPPAAFAGAGVTVNEADAGLADNVTADAAPDGSACGSPQELGDLPFPPAPEPITSDQTTDPETVAPAMRRRQPLVERCLFDEPLPTRRRGVSTPFAAPGQESQLAPSDPAEVIPQPDDVCAPEVAPGDPDVVVGGPAEPVQPLLPDKQSPAEQLQSHPETQPAASGIHKKIVWKFPAPLARQEDKA